MFMLDSKQPNSQPKNELEIIMAMVHDERVSFRFTIAEKVQRTFEVIGSTTWDEAQEYLESEGTYGENVEEIDGSHEFVQDYKPNRSQRVKQVKIGYKWYDLNDLVCDFHYYLQNDINIRNVFLAMSEAWKVA